MRRTLEPHPERGIALVTALLVLLMVSVLGTAFIATTTTERQVESGVHVARASLLSADGGVRAAQQVLANTGRVKLDSLLAIYSGSGPIVTNPANVFPAGNMTVTSTNPRFTAVASVAWADSDLADSAQTYDYRYTITSTGQHGQVGARQVQSTGILRISADRGTFADYLLFTQTHTAPGGGDIWFTSSSRFDGRVHTNDQFNFAFQPYFQDKASSVDAKAVFYNNGNPVTLAANNNGAIDVPQFFGGFQRGAPTVPLPTNSYNQQSAALGLASSGSAPSNSTIRTQLGLPVNSSAPPNGIYVVNSGGSVTGGIYIQGNADQMLMTADTTGNRQTYRIVQGSTTKTIVVNPGANTTSVTVGSTTTTYTGAPRGVTYVNGQVSDLRGPNRVSGSPPPALLDGQQMMIAATSDIVIQRDITMDNYDHGSAVLGIFSSNGDVRIGSSAPSDMNLDAYVMAVGAPSTSGVGAFEVDNYSSGSPRGTFHLRGGVVQKYYGAFFTFNSSGVLQTGYARDFRYDRRGLIPPYFPRTTLFVQTDRPSARTLAWKEL